MNAINPDLGLYVAEQTLIQRFKTSEKEIAQLGHLAKFCKLEPEDSKRYQTYLSLQRYKINMAMVDIVIMGLSQEMKNFVKARYRDDKSFHRIAMVNSYTLTEEDIYRPNVMRNMIHLLDMRINTFQETEKLKYNKIWLASLVDKRRRYRKLLETIMEVQAACRTGDIEDKEYVRYQVINEKICHNNENVSQIAGRCGVSLSTVHKHLKSYMDVVQKYIA